MKNVSILVLILCFKPGYGIVTIPKSVNKTQITKLNSTTIQNGNATFYSDQRSLVIQQWHSAWWASFCITGLIIMLMLGVLASRMWEDMAGNVPYPTHYDQFDKDHYLPAQGKNYLLNHNNWR